MIDAQGLSKRFGSKQAVDHLSFTVEPGHVTGFLGPNGAGKSTTMRLILGLDHADQGRALINGRKYTRAVAPMTEVGALLEAKSVHPGRTARNHLRSLAATHGISRARVDEVLEMVGLTAVARKRVGGYSMGMTQRLGLAGALLGDPETLILDEPINGLDPQGVVWTRQLLKELGAQGRTVLVSSHLMSEMALTADRILVIGQGRLLANASTDELLAQMSDVSTRVGSTQLAAIVALARGQGLAVEDNNDGTVTIHGWAAGDIGIEAQRRGWVLTELTPQTIGLEEAYMRLTSSEVEYASPGAAPVRPSPPPAPPVPPPTTASRLTSTAEQRQSGNDAFDQVLYHRDDRPVWHSQPSPTSVPPAPIEQAHHPSGQPAWPSQATWPDQPPAAPAVIAAAEQPLRPKRAWTEE